MSTREPTTWQEFLGQLIANPQERARLASALHVRPITLQRWTEGVSRPRDENIRLLIKNLPREIYPLFMRLLLVDFPGLLHDEVPEERFFQGLPAEFYARALSNLALTPMSIYRQSMQDLILQQMLQHLDPDQYGLSITFAICVPPRSGRKVRSLREVGGLATPPWPRNLAEKPMFLGIESLVGYAVTQVRPCVINSQDEVTFFPVQWTEHERSTASFPILRHGCIVGGLIVSSAREFFFTPPRLAVIEDYAHLASCIFEPEESFGSNEIELGVMPSYAHQYSYFSGYNERVSQKLVEAEAAGRPITLQQARQFVWQDLEELLLQVTLQIGIENLS
ncbi:MAG TPA: GAF domain-containing protein [Ktedonobacteraceae bacterium]|jgi:hypothetical protein